MRHAISQGQFWPLQTAHLLLLLFLLLLPWRRHFAVLEFYDLNMACRNGGKFPLPVWRHLRCKRTQNQANLKLLLLLFLLTC